MQYKRCLNSLWVAKNELGWKDCSRKQGGLDPLLKFLMHNLGLILVRLFTFHCHVPRSGDIKDLRHSGSRSDYSGEWEKIHWSLWGLLGWNQQNRPSSRLWRLFLPASLWWPAYYPQNATVEVKSQRNGFTKGCLTLSHQYVFFCPKLFAYYSGLCETARC